MPFLRNHFLLSFVSPITALGLLIRTRNTTKLFYGGVISFLFVGSIYVYSPGNDGHTHLMGVEEFYMNMGLGEFIQSFLSLLTFSNSEYTSVNDAYLHILSFLSGSVIGYPEMLHVFSAGIYGVIYMSAIKRYFKLKNEVTRTQKTFFIVFSVFLIFRGLTGINSIRWWTAFWLLFLCISEYAFTRKKFYLGLGILVPFVHFSFLAIGLPAVFAFWFRRKTQILFLVFITSFFLGASYDFIKPYVPEIDVIKKKEQYVVVGNTMGADLTKNTDKSPDKNIYVTYGDGFFVQIVVIILFILCFWLIWKYKVSWDTALIVFSAAVATYSFGNLMEFSPSLSGRSKAGASVLAMASFLLIAYDILKRGESIHPLARMAVNAFLILSIPMILFQLSYFINVVSVSLVVAPVVSWLVGDADITLKEFIVSLL